MLITDNIKRVVSDALIESWPELSGRVFQFAVERPEIETHGDYATNVALALAKVLGKKPIEVATTLIAILKKRTDLFKKVSVAGPGFINFELAPTYIYGGLRELLEQHQRFGHTDLNKGKRARVEFISANPTGPLHFGNARGGPIGDVLASVLTATGFKALREYYHNDIGGQVDKLGASLVGLAQGKPLEDQPYKGEYLRELVQKIGPVQDAAEAGAKAVSEIFASIIEDARALGIEFDKVYRESELSNSGATEKAIDILRAKGVLKEKDGALWLAPSDEFLKDRESVVKKSDGKYTYFANDIAYHDLKFSDKPELVIDVLGANHHGHVPRLKAAVGALGHDVAKFHVILYQWVRFKRAGQVVSMSKRAGNFVTAREVIEEVGRDAVRFFLLMHDSNTHIDFDLDLAREKSQKNPVYYAQYAYVRCVSIIEKSKIKNDLRSKQKSKLEPNLLTAREELTLIKQLIRLPDIVADIAQDFQVHRLTRYALDVARAFHDFYEKHRVITENESVTAARLQLVAATRIVLGNTFELLGLSKPERM